MAFCRNCGAQLVEGQNFCASCGTPVKVEEVKEAVATEAVTEEVKAEESVVTPISEQPSPISEQPIYAPAPETVEEKPKLARLNVLSLVLSIINIVYCCGIVFGVIGLILTLTARGTEIESANKKINIAKILGFIGIGVTVLGFIVYYIFCFVLGFLSGL